MKILQLFFIILISNLIFCQSNSIDGPYSNYFEKSTPEIEGINSESIMKFISRIEKEINELHSFMIIKNGKNIASGWWSPYTPEIPHEMNSLSKSFASTAIGFAYDERLINLDDRLIKFFPDYKLKSINEGIKNIRIRDLLTMTTGHEFEVRPYLNNKKDWIHSFMTSNPTFLPGNYFRYHSLATYLLSAIIYKISGDNLEDYLYNRLFLPLEIEKPFWKKCPNGISIGAVGLKIKTEDIAKFGQLYLQNGIWENKQLLSSDWIKMATSKQVDNSLTQSQPDWKQGYGFQFWKNRYNSYRGDGGFGQFCIIIPDHKIVIAITGNTNNMQGVLNIIWEEIYSKINLNNVFDNKSSKNIELNRKLNSLKVNVIKKTFLKDNKRNLNKTFFVNDNKFGIKTIRLSKLNENYLLSINANNEVENINISKKTFINSFLKKLNLTDNFFFNLSNLGQKKIPISANGGWVEKNKFSSKILFLEESSSTNLNLFFDKKEVEIEIVLKGVFGLQNVFKISGSTN